MRVVSKRKPNRQPNGGTLKPEYFMGIDPGKSGAIVLLTRKGVPKECIATDKDMAQTFGEIKPYLSYVEFACLEFVRAGVYHAGGRMGATSAFTFGRSYGELRTLLIATETRFEEPTPLVWQKDMGSKSKSSDPEHKNKLWARAQQMFPTVKIYKKYADAYLLAEYARRRALELGY